MNIGTKEGCSESARKPLYSRSDGDQTLPSAIKQNVCLTLNNKFFSYKRITVLKVDTVVYCPSDAHSGFLALSLSKASWFCSHPYLFLLVVYEYWHVCCQKQLHLNDKCPILCYLVLSGALEQCHIAWKPTTFFRLPFFVGPTKICVLL